MKININKLQKAVDAVKKLASKIEKDNLETATYLMFSAHYAKPNDTLIKSKLDEYYKKLNPSPSELTLEKIVDALNNLANKIKQDDLETANVLKFLAQKAGSNGPLIKRKFINYRKLNPSPSEFTLQALVKNGEVAIIPIGFRCQTKLSIATELNISQATLPFDNGFFPPASVASIIRNPIVNLKYPDDFLLHLF